MKTYAQKLNATRFTAKYISEHQEDFGSPVNQHAKQLVADGRGEFQYVDCYYCHEHSGGGFCEATLWADNDTTTTYHTHDRPINLDTLRLSYTYTELRAMTDAELAALQTSLGEFVTQQHHRRGEARILNDMIRDVRNPQYGWERYS